jgi:hypothetical protein
MRTTLLPLFVCLTAVGAAGHADARAVILQPASGVPTWMAGCWSGARGEERFHERWTLADSATLLGVSHTLKAGKVTAFEFLRVIVKNGKAVYLAQPGGVPPTEFVATETTADRIAFENPKHDFPKRVIYQRSGGDQLTASIDGGSAGSNRIEFEMKRQGCGE